jgi:transcriptional regulator GlxA family with amidase domain
MIADLVHVSRRQLERLFKRYLDTMPARYYLQLRLKKARDLLQTTNLSVVQIGLTCGFSSGPHFSSAYKSYFEITPREERSKRLYATKN